MEWLKPRLRELNKSGAGLARALGKPKERVYEMQRGDRRLQAEEVPAAARYLEMSEQELLAIITGEPVPPSAIFDPSPPADTSSSTKSQFGRKLPPLVIWKVVPHLGSRFGGFMLIAEKDGELPRSSDLEYNKKAFAFKVIDDANKAVYKQRDRLVVDPELTPAPDDDCIFAASMPTNRGALAVVGNLIRSTDDLWIISQYAAPETEIELSRHDYPHAWPIVERHRPR
jgi:hypothetical protein